MDLVPLGRLLEMKRFTVRYFAIFSLFSVLISCNYSSPNNVIQVGKYHFDVPKSYLVEERIFPSGAERALIFVLNPGSKPGEKISVLVDTREKVCANVDNAATLQLQRHCDVKDQSDLISQKDWNPRKVEQDQLGDRWLYRNDTRKGGKTVVASCIRVGGLNDSSCIVFGNYFDTIFTFRVPDEKIARVPELREEIIRKLETWRTTDT